MTNIIISLIHPMQKKKKKLPAMQEIQEIWIQSLGQEDALEKEMTTHSGILAMHIGARLQSMGLQKSQTRLND